MTSLATLSAELVVLIVTYCLTTDGYAKLAIIWTPYVYALIEEKILTALLTFLQIPKLYHTIDLSSHNANIKCKPRRFLDNCHVLVPPDFIERQLTELDRKVFKQQGMLIRPIDEGMKAGKEYRKYVRGVVRTILDLNYTWRCREWLWEDGETDEEFGDMYDLGDGECANHHGIIATNLSLEPLWQIFRSLPLSQALIFAG